MIDASKLAAEIERAKAELKNHVGTAEWEAGIKHRIAALEWVRDQGVPADDGTAEIVRDLMKRGQWT